MSPQKFIILLPIFTLITSCATTLNSLDRARNSEKYEKELEYHEGNKITLSIDFSDENTRDNLKHGSFTIRKQNITRFGLTGPLKISVSNVVHPYENNKILTYEDKNFLYSTLRSKYNFIGIVKKVARECRVADHELYSSACDNDEFQDEISFEGWGSDLQSIVDERVKLRTAQNLKESVDEQAINKEIQEKCGTYELKIKKLMSQMESYTQHDVIKEIKNKMDEERVKRKVEELGKQYNSEVTNSKYKGCPSNISDKLGQ